PAAPRRRPAALSGSAETTPVSAGPSALPDAVWTPPASTANGETSPRRRGPGDAHRDQGRRARRRSPDPGLSAASRAVPSGVPRPVQGSQPGPASYAPFEPTVTSRKPGGVTPGLAPPYSAWCGAPSGSPRACTSRQTSAAHNGATALVPPSTISCPSTRIR